MDTDAIIAAIDALKAGRLVVFPTDTVYGLGVAVEHAESPQAIFACKRRDGRKPVAWLVSGPEALDKYGADVPRQARELAERHWPGALTIVVKASDAVPPAFRADDGTIGLRMPDCETAQRLIRVVGPLAASSANPSGGAAPTDAADLDPGLLRQVAAVVRDGQSGGGSPSTVIDCSHGEPTVIRQGGIMVDVARAGFAEEGRSAAEPGAMGEGEAESAGVPEPVGSANSADPAEAPDAPEPAEAPESATPSDGIYISKVDYVSHDVKTHINAQIWTTAKFGDLDNPGTEDPRGIIQIVHGMAEYIDRYDDFARYLVGRGFVVCAEDHVGHGGSVADAEEYGHIPLRGGKDVVVGDVHTLHRMVSRCFPTASYVLYGHSMGSFIARAYIARYGDELAACVLSGTGNVPARLSKLGGTLAWLIAQVQGEMHRSKLIDNMGAGSYGKKIKGARTDLDWLSTDPAVVDAYIADEKCGFMFTVGGYSTLLDLTAEVVTPEHAAEVPEELPILLVAGDGDPVGDMGEGVKAAAQLYRDAGVRQVDCTIYPGMRHEIHNEIGHGRVYDDIATWIEDRL